MNWNKFLVGFIFGLVIVLGTVYLISHKANDERWPTAQMQQDYKWCSKMRTARLERAVAQVEKCS
jgi:1,4-dihydroxy-2-naphthoate octaprenyltransferase